MAQGGDEIGKLFVGGLSWETTQDSLSAFFSQFGEVVDCVVMINNETGRSRGFGFVTYKNPDCIDTVLSSGPHNLDGRTIDPKACNPRGMSKSAIDGKHKSKNDHPKVFLGGLPHNMTETDLKKFFSKYGKVVEVVIMYDQEKRRSRGFGFLSFETEDIVDQLCEEHYFTINGKQVECKKAESQDGRSRNRPNTSVNTQWNGSGVMSTGTDYQAGWSAQQPSAYPGFLGYPGWAATQVGYGYGGTGGYGTSTGSYGSSTESYGSSTGSYGAATASYGYGYGWGVGGAPESSVAQVTGSSKSDLVSGSDYGEYPDTKEAGDTSSTMKPDYSSFGGLEESSTSGATNYGGSKTSSYDRTSGQSTTYHPYRR